MGSVGVELQLCDLAGEYVAVLEIQGSDVSAGMMDLARDPDKLCCCTFAIDGAADFVVVVEKTLQRVGIAAAVGSVGPGHQPGEVLLLGGVLGEVRVDALGDIAEEALEAWRRIELLGFMRFAVCGFVSFCGSLAGFLGTLPRRVGVVEIHLALGDAGFEVVEIGVQDADLPQIAAFEALQLDAQMRQLGFAIGKRRPDSGQLLASVKKLSFSRRLLQDDFAWHGSLIIHAQPYSVRPGRDINSRIASRGLLSSWRMAAICSVMGISTP